MRFICNFCNNNFSQKFNLQRHLSDKKCKSIVSCNIIKIHDIIHEQKKEINKLLQNNLQKELEEIVEIEPEQIVEIEPEQIVENKPDLEITHLKFDGIFQGRESEIRITPDKKISVFDFIKVVGGQTNPRKT